MDRLPESLVKPRRGGDTIRPFARHQLAVPTQNGVRRHESRDLREPSATETVSQFGQTAALAVFEAQSMSLRAEPLGGGSLEQERDRVGLLTVDPASSSS